MKKKILILTALVVLLNGCIETQEIIGKAEEAACDNIDPSTFNKDWDKDHCYKDAALKQLKAELCAKIKKDGPRTKCYMEIAEKTGKEGHCENLVNNPPSSSYAYSRLECLQRVAVAQRDRGVCDKMGDASYHGLGGFYSKEECIKAVDRIPLKAAPDPGEGGSSKPGQDAL